MINERRLLIIVDAFKRVMTIEDEKKKSKFSLFVAQTIKYFLVGGIGVGVNLGLLYGLTDFLGMWYILSQEIAIAIPCDKIYHIPKKSVKPYNNPKLTPTPIPPTKKYLIVCATNNENLLFFFSSSIVITLLNASTIINNLLSLIIIYKKAWK
jgi:hypothetical protein